MSTFVRPSGELVEYFDSGLDAPVLVYHHGTPAAAPLHDDLLVPARDAGLRIVELIRPGYGTSTRMLGRTVADIAVLADELAAHLGADRYVTMGWSGGGPHALATLALNDRCVAGMCLAGVGMFDQPDLDFLAGMGEENIEEFGAAVQGDAALRTYLEAAAKELVNVTGADVIQAMSSLLPAADRDVLTGELAEWLASELRWSVQDGVDSWLDDDVAFVRPWGFTLAQVTKPLSIWQGSDDLMVPLAHGEWLSAHLPHASSHLLEGHGHLSIAGPALSAGLAQLRDAL